MDMKKLFLAVLVIVSACTSQDMIVIEETLSKNTNERSVLNTVDTLQVSRSSIRNFNEALQVAQSSIAKIESSTLKRTASPRRIDFGNTKILKANTSNRSANNTSDTLMYVFNFEENQGFAIVSADKNIIPLLAVTESGNYDPDMQTGIEGFDYYMEHQNNGRRYALVGFSQGGMLVLDLLKHMTDEQYNRMVAAYAIGYRITEEDCKNNHIRPASGETETGVTVSFNSALSTDGLWPLVAEGAVICINPVNWKTDSTPATFTYENEEHTVSIDKQTNMLIVKTNRPKYYRKWNNNPAFQSAKVHLDCLHHWDLLFYSDFIHDNILKRAGIE